jgi:hypothetical protein
MASNKGDIALDPFMGGGTTIAVADRLNRQWIGIDQSAMAVKVTELRLQKQADLFSSPTRCSFANTTMTPSVTKTRFSLRRGLFSRSAARGSVRPGRLRLPRLTAPQFVGPGLCYAKPLFGPPNHRIQQERYAIYVWQNFWQKHKNLLGQFDLIYYNWNMKTLQSAEAKTSFFLHFKGC